MGGPRRAREEGAGAIDLVYDADCGLCTRAVARLRRLDRTGRVRAHPGGAPGVAERFGLSPADLAASVWVIDDGRRLSGAAAVAAALDAARGTRFVTRLYRLPGVRHLAERCYRWVARHRHDFPGPVACRAEPPDRVESPDAAD